MQNATLIQLQLNNGSTFGNGVTQAALARFSSYRTQPLQRYLIYLCKSKREGRKRQFGELNAIGSTMMTMTVWRMMGSEVVQTRVRPEPPTDGDGLLDVDEYNHARNNPRGSNR
jgi:hypothetical protein